MPDADRGRDNLVTDEYLSGLGVEVSALRQALEAYTRGIERTMKARAVTGLTGAIMALGVAVAVLVSGVMIVRAEADRAAATLEAANLEACRQAAAVRVDLAAILTDLQATTASQTTGRDEWVNRAIERLSRDACTPGGDADR